MIFRNWSFLNVIFLEIGFIVIQRRLRYNIEMNDVIHFHIGNIRAKYKMTNKKRKFAIIGYVLGIAVRLQIRELYSTRFTKSINYYIFRTFFFLIWFNKLYRHQSTHRSADHRSTYSKRFTHLIPSSHLILLIAY